MKNLDTLQKEKAQIWQRIQTAMKEGNEEAFAQAFQEWTDILQEAVMAEARGLAQSADNTILAGRGVRVLTSEETKFYQAFIDAAKSATPQQALSNIDIVLPKTIIDAVFDDIQAAHPLLDMIDFQNTGALTEIYISTTSGNFVWGELTAALAGELSASFAKIDLTKDKGTAYVLVAKAMLDLGPVWVDRYVRALLVESASAGLEASIADGNGKNQFIGMTRKLTGAVDGVYPRKTAIPVTKLNADTYGTILNTLSQGPNSKRRSITEVLMVVNPADYFTKVMPATTVRRVDGSYATDVFPFPTKVVQQADIPAGYAAMGIAKRYFAGLGTSKGGKLEYDDSVKFFEDQRAYAIRLYGDGKALDENAFVLLDISKLVPDVQQVFVSNDALDVIRINDARLVSLAIGNKTLSPTFNKSIFAYECATTDATNTITAVAKDSEATIVIKNGTTTVTNGQAATWSAGANTVTVDVTSGEETERYTVIVTKS